MKDKSLVSKYRFRYLVLWGCIAALSAACAPLVNIDLPPGDTSLRTFEPCEPPCWYNIVPGRSTSANVTQVLPSLTFIDPQSIKKQPYSEEGGSTFSWWYTNPPGTYGQIQLRNDVVTRILARPGFRLDLREVVERFGPPDRVYPKNIIASDGGFYQVSFYYPNRGLALYTTQLPMVNTDPNTAVPFGGTYYGTAEYTIEPGYLVDTVFYIAPTTIEEMMHLLDAGPNPKLGEYAINHSYPWQGFGKFTVSSTPVP